LPGNTRDFHWNYRAGSGIRSCIDGRKRGRSGSRRIGRSGSRRIGRNRIRRFGRNGIRRFGRNGIRRIGRSGSRKRGRSGSRAMGRIRSREMGSDIKDYTSCMGGVRPLSRNTGKACAIEIQYRYQSRWARFTVLIKKC
jgi:hypothetical protein